MIYLFIYQIVTAAYLTQGDMHDIDRVMKNKTLKTIENN